MMNFDIKRKINNLRDILVGKVPDPKAQVEQITIALIYKFMDDIDLQGVEFGGSRVFFKDEYEKYAFSQIMLAEHSAQDKLDLYAEGTNKMVENPELPKLFRDILRNTYIPYRDPETLNRFLKEIAEFSYDDSEDLGNAFEYLLSIMGSQGDAGQFRTPRHIIDMMVEIVAPQKNETILDPSCGTAGFLISAYNYIKKHNLDKNGNSTLTPDDKNRMTENFEGYDISPDMVRLARVNMYLHGFTTPKIHEYDTLTSLDRWYDNFDVILANPPFMTPKGGINPHTRYHVKAKRAEVLFVDYIAEHLNNGGRAAIIVPEGVVFQSQTAYKNLRRMLVDEGYLYGVISLPSGVFNPYSGVKTSILLIDKTLAKPKDSILFVKLNNDGYDLGAQRRAIKGSEIPDVINVFKDYQKEKDVAETKNIVVALKSDISKQEYILVGERYVNAVNTINSMYPMIKLGEISNRITKGTTPTSIGFNFESEGINFIKIENISTSDGGFCGQFNHISEDCNNVLKRSQLAENDILFSIAGALGRVAIVTKDILPANTNQALSIISPKIDMVLPQYLFYILQSKFVLDKIKKLKVGVAQFNLSLKQISELEIPLPPIVAQQEIIEEIEQYQKSIDGARQIVDNYKPTIKINPQWNFVALEDLCVSIKNGINVEQIDEKGLYRVTRIQTIADGTVNLEKTKWTNDEPGDDYFMLEGDILLSHINSFEHLAKTAIFSGVDEKVVHGINLIRFRFDKNKILPKFAVLIMKSQGFIDEARKFAQRAVNQASIKVADLRKICIPVPNIEEQQRIVQQIAEEMLIIDGNKRLIEIFDSKIQSKLLEVWGS